MCWSQFSSVTQSCLTLCNPMGCSTPGFPVHHQLPEPTQLHVHHVGDASQPSHPLFCPSPLPSIFPSISIRQIQPDINEMWSREHRSMVGTPVVMLTPSSLYGSCEASLLELMSVSKFLITDPSSLSKASFLGMKWLMTLCLEEPHT